MTRGSAIRTAERHLSDVRANPGPTTLAFIIIYVARLPGWYIVPALEPS